MCRKLKVLIYESTVKENMTAELLAFPVFFLLSVKMDLQTTLNPKMKYLPIFPHISYRIASEHLL